MSSAPKDATARFSDRVADYVRTRPSYPAALLDAVLEALGLAPGDAVADLGSGTGISAKLLVERGLVVHAVEPNEPMRRAAEEMLAGDERFRSVNGTAEATTLADGSVRAVFAFQAFHWFDATKTRTELARILEPRAAGPQIALVWNERLVDTPFLEAYEALLQRASPDYGAVEHRNAYARIQAFFHSAVKELNAPNEQRFDREGFFGRVFSSSYVPKTGAVHEAFAQELGELFEHYADAEGKVAFRYDCKAFLGRIG